MGGGKSLLPQVKNYCTNPNLPGASLQSKFFLVELNPVSTDRARLGQLYSGPGSSWTWLRTHHRRQPWGGEAEAAAAEGPHPAGGESRSKLPPSWQV